MLWAIAIASFHCKPCDEFENMVRNLDVKSRLWISMLTGKAALPPRAAALRKASTVPALVQRTFREQFGLELPRSTYEQQEMGSSFTAQSAYGRSGSVPRRFHWSPCRYLYRQCNQFVHASTSSGVIISSMNEPYWKKNATMKRVEFWSRS